MSILVDKRLECNSRLKLNFDGGDLSYDSGLLLFKEFVHKIGLDKIIMAEFKTNDPASSGLHKDDENLLLKIYQTIAGYFRDNNADEFIKDPIFNTMLDKDALTLHPIISRFFNRVDKDTLNQPEEIDKTFSSVY